jgi:hypothetical protein
VDGDLLFGSIAQQIVAKASANADQAVAGFP